MPTLQRCPGILAIAAAWLLAELADVDVRSRQSDLMPGLNGLVRFFQIGRQFARVEQRRSAVSAKQSFFEACESWRITGQRDGDFPIVIEIRGDQFSQVSRTQVRDRVTTRRASKLAAQITWLATRLAVANERLIEIPRLLSATKLRKGSPIVSLEHVLAANKSLGHVVISVPISASNVASRRSSTLDCKPAKTVMVSMQMSARPAKWYDLLIGKREYRINAAE